MFDEDTSDDDCVVGGCVCVWTPQGGQAQLIQQQHEDSLCVVMCVYLSMCG